jgi:hypothetical protein
MHDVRVAILGCGPAGLFAAEACRQEGLKYSIYAPKNMSQIAGAQYLHKPIPELSSAEPEGLIDYLKIGTRDGYALKVYGHIGMEVSWDTFEPGKKPYWSLSDAYAQAWKIHEDKIRNTKVSPKHIRSMKRDYDLIINTAPKRFLCLKPQDHSFNDQKVFLSVPEERMMGNNKIVYNGQREVSWYRWSFIQGFSCYEFSDRPTWKKKEVLEIHKPLHTTCTCHKGDKYLEVGRYGRWEKRALTHEAYYMTMERLDEML